MNSANTDPKGYFELSYDKIGVQLDVLEAEQRTIELELERLNHAKAFSDNDPFVYLETFHSNYASRIQCSRDKLNDVNELEFPANADDRSLFMPAPSLFLSQNGRFSHALHRVGAHEVRAADDVQHEGPGFEVALIGSRPRSVSSKQTRRSRKRRLSQHTRPGAVTTRRRLSSNHLDVPQLLRLGALSLPDLTVVGPNPRLSRWEAHGRHGHACNIMLRSNSVVVVTARHSPPAAWRNPDTLVSVTLSLRSREAYTSASAAALRDRTSLGTSAPCVFRVQCSCKPSYIVFHSDPGDTSEGRR